MGRNNCARAAVCCAVLENMRHALLMPTCVASWKIIDKRSFRYKFSASPKWNSCDYIAKWLWHMYTAFRDDNMHRLLLLLPSMLLLLLPSSATPLPLKPWAFAVYKNVCAAAYVCAYVCECISSCMVCSFFYPVFCIFRARELSYYAFVGKHQSMVVRPSI